MQQVFRRCYQLAISVSCPPVLRRLNLRHLRLALPRDNSVEWLKPLAADLIHCSMLQSLEVRCVGDRGGAFGSESMDLPDMKLHTMVKLGHVELHGCFPKGSICLPSQRLLRVVGPNQGLGQALEEHFTQRGRSSA